MARILRLLFGAIITLPLPAQPPNSQPGNDLAAPEVDAKRGPTDPWIPTAEPRRARRPAPTDKGDAPAPAASYRDPFADPTFVLWDTPTPGEIWAATASYKVCFASGTATYVPFLGSDAPRNHPLDLRLADATVGGQALGLAAYPQPARHDGAVVFDHGPVRVRYDVGAAGLEQSFVLHRLPHRGELVIGIAVATDLEASAADEDLRFAAALGGVAYGKATAIDAGGRRLDVERELRGGRIEIRVPAEFVRTAALPLVVDPLVNTFTVVSSSSRALREPDIASGVVIGSRYYLVTCELVFSATDSDVYSYELDYNGAVVTGSFAAIDITTSSWQAPRVASVQALGELAGRYLVVAQWSAAGSSPYSIRGRTRRGHSTDMGNQFVISAPNQPNLGDKIRPDVAGFRVTGSDSFFTVVWERVYTAADHDIHARQVSADLDPVLRGATEILIDNASTYEETPQISNNTARNSPEPRNMVVYRRRATSGTDIRGRLVRPDGAMEPGFSVAAGDLLQSNPSVSTQSQPDGFGNILYLVAWRQGYITDGGDTGDIKVALCRHPGQRVSQVRLLHQIEGGSHGTWDQGQPRVSSNDGCRFVVCYTEDYQNSGDLDVRATTLHVSAPAPTAYEFGVTEGRVQVAYRSTIENQGAVCAASDLLSLDPNRLAFAWVDANGTSANEVRAQLYDGFRPGGGIRRVATACGDYFLFSFDPATNVSIGGSLVYYVDSNAVPLFGTPISPPIPACPPTACGLGVNPAGQLPRVSGVHIPIPCDPNLIGQSIACQAVKPGGPCFNAFSLSDTFVVTFR